MKNTDIFKQSNLIGIYRTYSLVCMCVCMCNVVCACPTTSRYSLSSLAYRIFTKIDPLVGYAYTNKFL